jgi:hypothetical protein
MCISTLAVDVDYITTLVWSDRGPVSSFLGLTDFVDLKKYTKFIYVGLQPSDKWLVTKRDYK